MLAKKTSKNQLTLPKAIVKKLPQTDYFEVELRGGEVILKPVMMKPAAERLREVRAKMKRIGVSEKDVDDAIRWARRRA